ncbi:unnamed protein product [Phytophthora fragariaefolia]|uniref:Unnamed protein product n=1 Tax=Phytophthora fragariaefolia TaxID=1490495 RepID=A0A9W6Y8G7_9STRA|nr:unnamed protein product [Phytophthora fragariaefolia]
MLLYILDVFNHIWKALRRAGWTSKPPPARSLDMRYRYIRVGGNTNGIEGQDYFLGERAVVDHYFDSMDGGASAVMTTIAREPLGIVCVREGSISSTGTRESCPFQNDKRSEIIINLPADQVEANAQDHAVPSPTEPATVRCAVCKDECTKSRSCTLCGAFLHHFCSRDVCASLNLRGPDGTNIVDFGDACYCSKPCYHGASVSAVGLGDINRATTGYNNEGVSQLQVSTALTSQEVQARSSAEIRSYTFKEAPTAVKQKGLRPKGKQKSLGSLKPRAATKPKKSIEPMSNRTTKPIKAPTQARPSKFSSDMTALGNELKSQIQFVTAKKTVEFGESWSSLCAVSPKYSGIPSLSDDFEEVDESGYREWSTFRGPKALHIDLCPAEVEAIEGMSFSPTASLDQVPVFVVFSNEYARTHGNSSPNPIELDEIMKFLGILWYMALVDKGEMWNYWVDNEEENIFPCSTSTYLSSIMSWRRFLYIRSNLSFRDKVSDDEVKRDPVAKIRSLITMLKKRCALHVTPGRNVAVDETSIACRSKFARHLIVYNPRKPTGKYHFKLYTCCCSTTWMVLGFKLHCSSELAKRLTNVVSAAELERISATTKSLRIFELMFLISCDEENLVNGGNDVVLNTRDKHRSFVAGLAREMFDGTW